MLTWLLLGCLLTPVPDDLRDVWFQACSAWWPYHAQVTVRYCNNHDECEKIGNFGGGVYCNFKQICAVLGLDIEDRTIVLLKDRVNPLMLHPFLRNMGEPTEKYLLLLHEYGHALGLGHSQDSMSIMKQGWDWPLALGPSPEDLEELRKLNKTP